VTQACVHLCIIKFKKRRVASLVSGTGEKGHSSVAESTVQKCRMWAAAECGTEVKERKNINFRKRSLRFQL
jgi:hypothetical protein